MATLDHQLRATPEEIYNHGFATLALAEAHGMVNDKRLGKALKNAVALTVSSQKRNPMGSWRLQS